MPPFFLSTASGGFDFRGQSYFATQSPLLMEIYFACVQAEFEKLAFKERQILGGFFGVYDFPKQTLADLAEEFQMTENALLKAKDKALKKLTTACMAGELGVWRKMRGLVRQAQREHRRYTNFTTQTVWYEKE